MSESEIRKMVEDILSSSNTEEDMILTPRKIAESKEYGDINYEMALFLLQRRGCPIFPRKGKKSPYLIYKKAFDAWLERGCR